MLNKVPEVALIFWVIRIMSTTVGETGADYLAVHVGLGTAITGGIMVALLVAALLVRLRSRQYVAWTYWLTVGPRRRNSVGQPLPTLGVPEVNHDRPPTSHLAAALKSRFGFPETETSR